VTHHRKEKLPGRNDKCPCGSGKKAKRCCLNNIKTLAALPPYLREQFIVANILRQPVGVTPAPLEKTAKATGVSVQLVSSAVTADGVPIPVESQKISVDTPDLQYDAHR
jgi:hypothetical protein